MSQILIDSLKNLNNTAIETLQTKKTDLTSAMDKSKDFSKTFEKTLSRPEANKTTQETKDSNDTKFVDNTKTLADIKTLGDIKTKNVDLTSTQDLTTFKEILAKASSEANVETSLDLTLSKDMSELIAKFKELLEKIKSDFSKVDDENVSTEIVAEDGSEEVEDTTFISDLLNMLSDITKSEDSIKEMDLSALYSQVSLVLNNKLQDFSADKTNLENLEQLKSMLEEISKEDTSLVFDSANEIMEFVDKTVSEVVAKPATETQEADFELQLDEDILKELNIEQIQADAGNGDFSENFMQNQSAEEHALKAMIANDTEAFDIKIDKTVSIQQAQTSQPKQVDVNPSKILSQIAKQLEGLQNNSKVNIVLNPEALGKVNVQLLSTKEGLMAQFTVATQEARDVLMKGLDGLKESLLSHGVSVDNVSVKMSETQKSTYNPDWTEQEGSRGGNKEQGRSNKDEKEKGLFERMMAQVNQENGEV